MIDEPLDWARVPTDNFGDRAVRRRLLQWERDNQAQGRKVTARRIDDALVFEAWDGLQTRAIDSFTDHPGLTEQLMAVQGLTPRPWRVAGAREALGVPAINRAVTLLSTTGAQLSVRAFRNGIEMAPEDRPKIFVRPDPLRKPRDFFRDTIYSMATRGEAIWWVAKRDNDGLASALRVVNPAEVTFEEDPKDLRYPKIMWRGNRMRNEDIRQITLLQELGSLRGYGPLQVCGAAISVSVEAQEWAANFFASGGVPSVVIKAAGLLGGDPDPDADDFDVTDTDTWDTEAARLRNAWISGSSNMPKVIDQDIESVEPFSINEAGAQLNDARQFQNGEAALMFGLGASLLNHSMPGSNLTYQNIEQEFIKFIKTCLKPIYLEPIEQELSDLAPRSVTGQFNVDHFLQADIKTRYEVYKLGRESQVLEIEEARKMEGLQAGSVEVAPVPQSLPASIPSIPLRVRSAEEVRCEGKLILRGRLTPCGRKLGMLSAPYETTCPRCKTVNTAA